MSMHNPILPLEADMIRAAEAIRKRLLDGELVPYGDMDAIDDMRADELFRHLPIEEVPGEGWRLGIEARSETLSAMLASASPEGLVVVDDGQFLAAVRRDRIEAEGASEHEIRAMDAEEYAAWFRAVTECDDLPHEALTREEADYLLAHGAGDWYAGG